MEKSLTYLQMVSAREVPSPSRKYRKFATPDGRVYWLGRKGALRVGRTVAESVSITDTVAKIVRSAPTTAKPTTKPTTESARESGLAKAVLAEVERLIRVGAPIETTANWVAADVLRHLNPMELNEVRPAVERRWPDLAKIIKDVYPHRWTT